ncbi:MAG: (Fe-S)-binding protein, partial [Pseudomonadota bacterium]
MIKELEGDVAKCMKCGLCQSVCPVFLELGHEPSVARGKIALVEALTEGKIKVTPSLQEKLQCCLVCGTCMENCPSGVRVDHIVLRSRVIAAKIRGLSPIKWLMIKVILRNRRLFHLGMKVGSILQRVLFKPTGMWNTRKSRLYKGLDRRRVVLPLASKALRDTWREVNSPDSKRGRVGFFTGCTANYVLTDIGDAV